MKKNEFLEKLRKDLGYSRKKIGEYLEVSPTTIERYEKGKVDFNHKTKYVLGICALAGYDNEIFMLDEIDENDTYDFKLTLFSSKLREILYFLNIEYDEYELFLVKLLQNTYNLKWSFHYDVLLKRIDIGELLLKQKYYLQTEIIEYLNNKSKFIQKKRNFFSKIIKNIDSLNTQMFYEEKNIEEEKNKFFLQLRFEIFTLYALKTFNTKEFFEKNKIPYISETLKDFEIFIQPLKISIGEMYDEAPILKNLFPTIKQTLEELMIKGKSVNKETIKEFKIELETGAILSTCNEPTDPKDKQICELLQYAPPAFKDKIIEKLLKFKDEVEDI